MEDFSIAFNPNVGGSIPSAMFDLKHLRSLQVIATQVGGPISPSISNFGKLKDLYLWSNAFSGSLPPGMFQGLGSLREVALDDNFFTGTLPEFLSNADYEFINVGWNHVTGTIPESIYSSSSLQYLALDSNQLSGSLSSKVGDLVDLRALAVDTNHLSGTLPTQIGALINLKHLWLNSNALTGTIPTEIGLLERLNSLGVFNNHISGPVPTELSNLSAEWIDIHGNNLTGSLDMFCNREDLLIKLAADCGGDNPLMDCPCCATCCTPLGECELVNDGICEIDSSNFESPSGRLHREDAGTECECLEDFESDNNLTLSCRDTICESCSLDQHVCVISIEHRYTYYGPAWGDFRAEFQYTSGEYKDTIVVFENQLINEFGDWECTVTVNGQQCNSCRRFYCESGWDGYSVGCQNLGLGHVDNCQVREEDAHGPLAVFAFQDSLFHTGCSPRLYPTNAEELYT